MGENLDDNPRLLKGPYDSFGSALVKSGLLCEDACGEDGHSEQVWRDGLFELDDVLDNALGAGLGYALSRTIRTGLLSGSAVGRIAPATCGGSPIPLLSSRRLPAQPDVSRQVLVLLSWTSAQSDVLSPPFDRLRWPPPNWTFLGRVLSV